MLKPKTLLLLATRNPGKLKEYEFLFHNLPLKRVTLLELGIQERIAEGGASLEENARLKAQGYATMTGHLTLAEDSGLEVAVLGGEPGAMSARYGGEGLSDEQRTAILLQKLKGIPWESRKARFRCIIALCYPEGETRFFAGECSGVITLKPGGKGGFGYDPVFYIPELKKTLAQLSIEQKNQVSHRGKAGQQVRLFLEKEVKA